MRVVINAVSAKMGGALAYLRNFLLTLADVDKENSYVVFVQSSLADEFRGLAPNITIETDRTAERGEPGRIFFDQWRLRRALKRLGADCVFAIANFGVLAPSVPQVVFVRNAIYFCRRYYRHIESFEGRRAVVKTALRRRMIELSAKSSAVVATPTAAMRDMMLEWGGGGGEVGGALDGEKCVVIHHGFDRKRFLSMAPSMDERLSDNLERRGDEKLLLCPSLYAKHKNFDTMIEAVAQLRRKGLDVRLLLACTIDPEADPYQQKTSRVIRESGIDEGLTMLGNQPYANMPLLYRSADVVLWPTFTESFGHPLLEATACSKPVVASDIPVNREILQDAALYFDTFEAAAMAEKIEASLDADTAARLVDAGRRRVRDFSWQGHVRSFVEIFTGLGAR